MLAKQVPWFPNLDNTYNFCAKNAISVRLKQDKMKGHKNIRRTKWWGEKTSKLIEKREEN